VGTGVELLISRKKSSAEEFTVHAVCPFTIS
jgi:hypothetical protein